MHKASYTLQSATMRASRGMGARGGPLAYVGGARFADVALPLGTLQTGQLLMPIWTLAMPLLARLAARR